MFEIFIAREESHVDDDYGENIGEGGGARQGLSG
jgi:hypothetical protein